MNRRNRGWPSAVFGPALLCLAALSGCERPLADSLPVDTTIADPPPAVLAGTLSYPSDYIPGDMRVCAQNVASNSLRCSARVSDQGGRRVYELEVPAGTYHVYATTRNFPNYRAFYSDAVRCGLTANCVSHAPIAVTMSAGERRQGIDPGDWYAAPPAESGASNPSAAPPSEPSTPQEHWTEAEAALIARWEELNLRCRGGAGDAEATSAACEERDGSAAAGLRRADICYGREGEYGYQMRVHRCAADSVHVTD